MGEAACQAFVLPLVTEEEREEEKGKEARETWMNDWFKKRSIFAR
jgi:hypothetical protein